MVCDYQCSVCDAWLPYLLHDVIPHHTEGFHRDRDVYTGGNYPLRCPGSDLSAQGKRVKEVKEYERRAFKTL